MKCPKCGNKWHVINTASNGDTSRLYLRSMITELLSWYTEDFVVRHRSCSSCSYASITVELERSDLIEVCNIVSEEGLPRVLVRPSVSES